MRAIPHVYYGIILDVSTVAEANVIDIASHRAVAPNRGFLAEVNVAYYLGATVHKCGWVNLRVNTPKRSNHKFADISIAGVRRKLGGKDYLKLHGRRVSQPCLAKSICGRGLCAKFRPWPSS